MFDILKDQPDHVDAASHDVAPAASVPQRLVRGFRRYRRTRPFWGALLLIAGGWFVMVPVIGGSVALIVKMGIGGVSSYVLGGGMIAAALVALVKPDQRHFPAVMASLFAVASLPLANLGGWIIGMLLGIIGSGLVFAWTPYTDKQLARLNGRDERRAARRAARKAGVGGRPKRH